MPTPIVIISEPEFDRDVKRLRKKNRLIAEDIRGLLQDFNRLGIYGELVVGFDREFRNVRLTNRSAKRGKSGGFRALYVVENEFTIRLIRLYSKTEEAILSRVEVVRILESLP